MTEAALGAAKAFVAELVRGAAGANANVEKGDETTDAVVVARDGEQTGFAAAIAQSKADAGQHGEKQRKADRIEKEKARRKPKAAHKGAADALLKSLEEDQARRMKEFAEISKLIEKRQLGLNSDD